jgi:hypothetical protein
VCSLCSQELATAPNPKPDEYTLQPTPYFMKVKVKLSLCLINHHTMKRYVGMYVCIHNLGSRWKQTNSFTPLPPYCRGNRCRYPPDRWLAGDPGHLDTMQKREKPLASAKDWKLIPQCPAHSLISILTELPQVRFILILPSHLHLKQGPKIYVERYFTLDKEFWDIRKIDKEFWDIRKKINNL